MDAVRMVSSVSRTRPAFYEHWRKIIGDPDTTVRTVEADGGVAGYVSAFRRDGRREIADWLGREYWRKGIGRRAVSAFLELYRERPVFGSVAISNIASLAILHRCGFLLMAEEAGSDGLRE